MFVSCRRSKKGRIQIIVYWATEYVFAALDDYVKKSNENPSIGIILCRSADKTYVEYAVRDYQKPMGVATYKTLADMPEKMRNALPSIEEIEEKLKTKNV